MYLALPCSLLSPINFSHSFDFKHNYGEISRMIKYRFDFVLFLRCHIYYKYCDHVF